MMSKPLPILSLLTAALAAAILPAPAMARSHGHVLSVQGAHGRGYTAQRWVSRQPGSASFNRSVQANNGRGYSTSRERNYGPGHFDNRRSIQTNDGRGATATRNAQWGDGHYNGSRQVVTNDGRTLSRTTSAYANGDGSVGYATTVAGPNGGTRTVSGTAYPHR